MSVLNPPTLRDVMLARKVIYRYITPSPLMSYGGINDLVGTELYLKHENLLPTRSFKVRGATFLISRLSDKERKRGVIAASTGNFSQGVSYAARKMGITAKIVMPEHSNQEKINATKALGGDIVFHGSKFDDAREYAEELAEKHGYRYIHSANEPDLVAGVGTHTYEIVEQVPDIDTIIVPVGGGSGAAGAITSAKSFDRRIRVIGVQSENSPAAYLSWKEKKIVRAGNNSFAEGVATGEGYEFTQEIMRKGLDDFILVSDDEIRDSMKIIFHATGMAVESASSSTLAAALKIGKEKLGKKVALVITGGNTPGDQKDALITGK